MSNVMDRERSSASHRQKARKASEAGQLVLWTKDHKAKCPSVVKSHHDLPKKWAKFYEKYRIGVRTRLVAEADTDRHALAETLAAWRKEKSRQDAAESHPRLF